MSTDPSEPPIVSQHGNVIGGHNAGRDINFGATPRRPSHMARLIAKFQSEREADTQIDAVSNALDFFLRHRDDDPRGLEAKLADAGQAAELRLAMSLKEQFHKKLTLYQLTPAAQEIFTVALSKLWIQFDNRARPLIERGVDYNTVRATVVTEIVDALYEDFEDNPMDISYHEVMGMVWFLTGNCYLSWNRA